VDDAGCAPASLASKIKIGGCTADDTDFNSPTYLLDWPGTLVDPKADAKIHPAPVRFSGSLVSPSDGAAHQFDSVAFETDLLAIEGGFHNPASCDNVTGNGCVNPPPGASFYPVYSTTPDANKQCLWQLGGTELPNTTSSFGDSAMEYGTTALPLVYPSVGGAVTRYFDFQTALSSNPCDAALPSLTPNPSSITFGTTKAGKKSSVKMVKLMNSLTNKLGLGVASIEFSTDNPVFVVAKDTCGTEVPAKGSCGVSVAGTPTSAGHTDTGNLIIKSDSSGGIIKVPLSIKGS
jgi:hypothetical protein